MIGRLKGTLIAKDQGEALLDVSGVGYEVAISLLTYTALPHLGEEVILLIHFMVREDAQQLYGFLHENERTLFRLLLKINGVGGKLALTILSSLSPKEFVDAIQRENVALLTRLPGIGKKTAERLVLEMKDKLKTLSYSMDMESVSSKQPLPMSMHEEVVNALQTLGFKSEEARRMMERILRNQTDVTHLTTEQLIRLALKELATC